MRVITVRGIGVVFVHGRLDDMWTQKNGTKSTVPNVNIISQNVHKTNTHLKASFFMGFIYSVRANLCRLVNRRS